jgi:SAM-dependent methyltransferase
MSEAQMEGASVHPQPQSWSGSLRERVVRAGRPIHKRLRKEKLNLFLELSSRAKKNSLLDVGGSSGIDSEWVPLYQAFREVTVVNLDPSPDQHALPHVRRIVADGCCLPFANGSFDWVFSNAVLEHVGGAGQQRKFAAEISRVARYGYFVTTPNKLFPIEPHTLLPLYQFLPERWQRTLVRISPYYVHVYEEIRLLGSREMRELFPGARIVSTGFPIVGTSLVAMRTEDMPQREEWPMGSIAGGKTPQL